MPQPIRLESQVVASPEQVACEVAGEMVILNLRNGEYYGLDPVGAKIWDLMQQPRPVVEIRDALLEEYPDVTPEQCTEDLLELLQSMVKTGLADVVVASEV